MTSPRTPAPPDEVVAGIVLAAGSSSRMGFDKMWAPLDGLPVVGWTIRAFAASPSIRSLVVAVQAGGERRMQELLDRLGVVGQVVVGGEQRQDSVRAGLEASVGADWVAVHDGARALITTDVIERGIVEARVTGAAIAAVPTTDTIKVVEVERIVGTPDRGTLWSAQTPQIFRRELLMRAHDAATASASDDAAIVEALGVTVRVYFGAYGNIKITTPVDLQIAATLLTAARSSPERGPADEKDDYGGAFPESSGQRQLSRRDRP